MPRFGQGSAAPTYEVAAVALLCASNIALNRGLPRRYIVPSALASAAGMLLVARMAGAKVDQQGLAMKAVPAGGRIGLLIAIPLAAATFAGAFLPFTRGYYRDDRVVRVSASSAFYEIFVRIPLATAASEELLFRSGLEAILRLRRTSWQTLLASNALFGAWHLFPALDHLRSNPRPSEDRRRATTGTLRLVIAHCGATAVAGLALSLLRRGTGSVVAPILVHYGVNSGAFGGAWLASNLRTFPQTDGVRPPKRGNCAENQNNNNQARSAPQP
jgi:membrane protease YdiL (CAAX protease family)